MNSKRERVACLTGLISIKN